MVWHGILIEAHTELVFVENGAIIAHRYIREYLNTHVVSYAPFIGNKFLLMHDYARPQIERTVVHYLIEVGIQRLPWPVNSADLNPINYMWDFLGKRVRQRQRLPQSPNN